MAYRSVWLIANPTAGRKGGLTLNASGPEEARAALERSGLAPELRVTERPGHATLFARQAVAAGADLIVAAGGDGTVHEVAAALIRTPHAARSAATLAILPLGSMMNLARALGIPRGLDEAAALIARGRIVWMDVGIVRTAATESFFLEAAGVGLDAGIFAYGNQLEGGKWRYLLPLLRFLARYRARPARVEVDGRRITVPRALMLSVAISPYIGMALTLAPGAKLDDRHFDVVVREAAGRADMVRHAAAMLFGTRPRSPRAVTLRGRRVSVDHLDGPMLVHADGELVGRTPAELELLPGALPVVAARPGRGAVPAGAPTRAGRTPAAPTRLAHTTTPPAAPGRPRQPR
ncbi:MAG TPA: diacylglycerol kinase family protein [Chloroflexota bacterium]